jgi:hypothetical protein
MTLAVCNAEVSPNLANLALAYRSQADVRKKAKRKSGKERQARGEQANDKK